jgi:DNA-binding NarL/FixJ family response regulator
VYPRIPGSGDSCDENGVGTHKVLIADDDARVRLVLRQIVAKGASSIYEARDGEEAVAVCAAERPDWVIMDWRMAPVDGLSATTRIRTRFPETRVIILSRDDDPGLRAEAQRVGAFACVLKENLLQLEDLLSGGSGQ